MDPERQAIARRVLLRLTQPGEGAEDTRRRAERRELVTRPEEEAAVDGVVNALAEARLVTTGRDEVTGEPVVEVTHEALIRGWPELRGWIDEDRDRLRAERRLSDAAAEWDRGGRDEGALYRGARLAAWQERDTSELTPLERDYLDASNERAERERRTRRRRTRITIGALAGVAAIIAGIAVFAFIQRNDANDQRLVATSRQLAGSSTVARQRDPELATLLGESAYAASPTIEAEESLRQGVHDSAIRATLRTPDQLALAAVPAPGGRLAVVTESGTLRLWDPEGDPRGASPEAVGRWPGGLSAFPAPTEAGYVTGTKTGGLVLWPDLAAPRAPERIAKVQGQVITVHPLSDRNRVIVATTKGIWLVGLGDHRVRRVAPGYFYDAVEGPTPGSYLTAGNDGTLQRWSDGSSSSTPIPLKGAPRDLAVSPDGALLAVGADTGVIVLRLGDHSVVFSAPVKGGVNDVNWSADGGRLVAGGGDASVRVYTKDGRPLSLMEGHETSVNTAVFTGPDTVASVAGDGTARVWDAAVGVEHQLRGQTPAPVGGITFDDRARITLIDGDGAAVSWNPGRAGVRPLLPAVAPASVYSAAAAGDLIAAGLFDGRVIVRDGSGDQLASATFPLKLPISVTVDPRTRRAAAALDDGRVEVIDLARGEAEDDRPSRRRGVRRRVQPGRRHDRQRRPRRHGEGVGRPRWVADPRHARRRGERRRLQPERPLARGRRPRPDGAHLGPLREGAAADHPEPPGLRHVCGVRRRRPDRLGRQRRRPGHGLASWGDAADDPTPRPVGDRDGQRPGDCLLRPGQRRPGIRVRRLRPDRRRRGGGTEAHDARADRRRADRFPRPELTRRTHGLHLPE